MISAALPRAAFGNKLPLMRGIESDPRPMLSMLNSMVVDFCVRQKVGGSTLNFFYVKQFPLLEPDNLPAESMADHVLELSYTSRDLSGFSEAMGYFGEPFRWDVERRLELRSELDAFILMRFGVSRADVGHVMDSFPIVRRQEVSDYGHFRSRDVVLGFYDRMTAAAEVGVPYKTQIDPPPADPSLAHPTSASY